VPSACGVARHQWESCLGGDVLLTGRQQTTKHKVVRAQATLFHPQCPNRAVWEGYALTMSLSMAFLVVSLIDLYLLFFVNIGTVCVYKTFHYIYQVREK